MSVVVKQVSQDLPCIGATALTEVRPVNVGSLLQYDDSLYGVVRAIKPVRNACLYTLNTGVLFSEYIAEYQSEVELDIEFQPIASLHASWFLASVSRVSANTHRVPAETRDTPGRGGIPDWDCRKGDVFRFGKS